jgi:hypothetical protein
VQKSLISVGFCPLSSRSTPIGDQYSINPGRIAAIAQRRKSSPGPLAPSRPAQEENDTGKIHGAAAVFDEALIDCGSAGLAANASSGLADVLPNRRADEFLETAA